MSSRLPPSPRNLRRPIFARMYARMHRVLRPGDEPRFLEHVAAETAMPRAVQRLADAGL
jgi:hypothetical protein